MEQANDRERMMAKVQSQIDELTGGTDEYLHWFEQQSPENKQALDLLRVRTLREAVTLPPAPFASLMGVIVATHHHLYILWRNRELLDEPTTVMLLTAPGRVQ